MDPALKFEQTITARNKPLLERTEHANSTIQRFYAGKVIFITGGSGFIGKLLIEKLLRTCTIKKVYVLIRSKKNASPQQRLNDILEDPLFDRINQKMPNFKYKLAAIDGDIGKIKLGISEENWGIITEEVDVIYHNAAVVKFDAPLKTVVLENVRGTREALKLGMSCKNIKAFVYVSTAYSHATQSRIGTEILEQFNETPAPPESLIEFAENLDEKKLREITPVLTTDWPNTYSFSKALAEETIRIMGSNLPISIVKPAIVITTNREPTPGWIDTNCVFGPSGLIVGIGLGLLHVLLTDVNAKNNVVPADMVTNAIIAAGWETARRHAAGDKETKIYAVSNVRNPIVWGNISKVMRNEAIQFMSPRVTWYPWGVETKNKYMFWIYSWLFHFIPAYVIDAICLVIGKPRRFVKLYTKVYKMTTLFGYFNCNEWKFNDDNLHNLHMSMSEEDRDVFNFDITRVDWIEQLYIWLIGLRKYIIKDGLTGTEYGLRKFFWLRMLHYVVSAIYIYCMWKVTSGLFYLIHILFSMVFC